MGREGGAPPWGLALQLCLIALKAGGMVDWEWRWVLAPTWACCGAIAALGAAEAALTALARAMRRFRSWTRG